GPFRPYGSNELPPRLATEPNDATVPQRSGPLQERQSQPVPTRPAHSWASASAVARHEARKQRLGVAPRALIEGGIAARQGDRGALALFDHGDGAGREPSARGSRCERSLRQTLAVGRIEERQSEAMIFACRSEFRRITAEDFGDAGQPEH